MMNKEIIIEVNADDAHLFFDFADKVPGDIIGVEKRTFIETTALQEFIVNITPHLLTALTAYLVAKVHNSKKEIRIKKGNIEIEIKNTEVSPQTVLELLYKLEKK